MCTVLLPPGDNPIAVNKYIISYHIRAGERPKTYALDRAAAGTGNYFDPKKHKCRRKIPE